MDDLPPPSPRSTSLQATATLNAGLRREEPSRQSSSGSVSRNTGTPLSIGRRRSQILMSLAIADPSVPSPGEMSSASPVRESPNSPGPDQRLVELHQQMENEQEAQVNRLLAQIRELETQLEQSKASHPSGSAIDDSDPASVPIPRTSTPASRAPSFSQHPRSPTLSMARADLARRSRTPSRGASPRIRAPSATSISDSEFMMLGGRNEINLLQAETHNLQRENQMLQRRIRELERQMAEASGTATVAAITHEPAHPSHLLRSTSVSEEEPQSNDAKGAK